jgi:hypothetical protein
MSLDPTQSSLLVDEGLLDPMVNMTGSSLPPHAM